MTKSSPAAVRLVPGLVLLASGIWFGFVVLLAKRGGMDLSLGLSSGAIAAIAALSGVGAVVYFLSADAVNESSSWPRALIVAGLVCLAIGTYIGLFVAPPEQYMGETQRIMYVHVPTAWNALLAITFGFASAVFFLFTSDFRWDARMEASLEVGVVLAFLLCCQGAIWAKPTWGVWWDWDPRLTTTAVLVFAFLGILALRKFVDDPLRRGVWSGVATIIAYVDVPIVYYSVKWWNSLHQAQSTPSTVAQQFWLPLRANAFGLLFLMTGFIMLRARIAQLRLQDELAPPPLVEGELGEAV
jgi:heme exporter protein C